jgi:hypothetical protein
MPVVAGVSHAKVALHICEGGHDPHVPPHPSGPHVLPVQLAWHPAPASEEAGWPQVFATPPPPHVWGAVQLPHESWLPQPSGIEPQVAPCAAQLVGVQPQTLAVPPPPQTCGVAQVPQSSVWPHPSEMAPQSSPALVQLVGVHVPEPQTFAPPPPHVCDPVQVPQLRLPPHPSGSVPQSAPRLAQVAGVHVQACALLQVSGDGHVPHDSVPPQPFATEPHCAPWAAQVVDAQVPPSGRVPESWPASVETSAAASPCESEEGPLLSLDEQWSSALMHAATVIAPSAVRTDMVVSVLCEVAPGRARRVPRETAAEDGDSHATPCFAPPGPERKSRCAHHNGPAAARHLWVQRTSLGSRVL